MREQRYKSCMKSGCYQRRSSSSSSNKYSDPYDVQDYDDTEDFYYDNYDYLDGYEDAEDYWNENHD